MPAQWREALASRKLNPCFTLIIFSFMVSFTLSIMDLTLRINSLHLPVLVMWLITLCSVLLTVVFWYCHSSISSVLKRPRNQRPPPSPVERDRDLGRSQEAVASKLELPSKTENSSLLRKWKEILNITMMNGYCTAVRWIYGCKATWNWWNFRTCFSSTLKLIFPGSGPINWWQWKRKSANQKCDSECSILPHLCFFLCQTYIVNQKQSSASTENKEQARKQRAQLGVGLN